MRPPNNVVFTSSQAEFDETLFPKCDPKHKHRVRDTLPAPPRDDHSPPDAPDGDDDGDDTPPPCRSPPRHPSPKQSGSAPDQPAAPPAPKPEPDEPPAATDDDVLPEEPPAPRRSTRERNVPRQPGNVYGELRDPTQIERDARSLARWKRQVGETEPSSGTRPRHQRHRRQDPVTSLPPAPPPATTSEDTCAQDPDHDVSEPPSGDEELARLCREGGAAFVNFLLSKGTRSRLLIAANQTGGRQNKEG